MKPLTWRRFLIQNSNAEENCLPNGTHYNFIELSRLNGYKGGVRGG